MKKIICCLLCCVILSGVVFGASASSLQYSTYTSTPSNYATTNCYGYVLGKAVAVDPGYYSSSSYNGSNSFKTCIINDLKALGYSVRTASSPDASLNSNEIMIAYYYGIWKTASMGGGTFGEEKSYHFWKKEHNGSPWYHKFGTKSGIMKFKYTPISSNKGYVSDEYYNGITGVYSPAGYFADSGSWGYIIFNYYSSVSPTSNQTNLLSQQETSGELDHSIAALIDAARNANGQ